MSMRRCVRFCRFKSELKQQNVVPRCFTTAMCRCAPINTVYFVSLVKFVQRKLKIVVRFGKFSCTKTLSIHKILRNVIFGSFLEEDLELCICVQFFCVTRCRNQLMSNFKQHFVIFGMIIIFNKTDCDKMQSYNTVR